MHATHTDTQGIVPGAPSVQNILAVRCPVFLFCPLFKSDFTWRQLAERFMCTDMHFFLPA